MAWICSNTQCIYTGCKRISEIREGNKRKIYKNMYTLHSWIVLTLLMDPCCFQNKMKHIGQINKHHQLFVDHWILSAIVCMLTRIPQYIYYDYPSRWLWNRFLFAASINCVVVSAVIKFMELSPPPPHFNTPHTCTLKILVLITDELQGKYWRQGRWVEQMLIHQRLSYRTAYDVKCDGDLQAIDILPTMGRPWVSVPPRNHSCHLFWMMERNHR